MHLVIAPYNIHDIDSQATQMFLHLLFMKNCSWMDVNIFLAEEAVENGCHLIEVFILSQGGGLAHLLAGDDAVN